MEGILHLGKVLDELTPQTYVYSIKAEDTFDPQYVADAVLHIASLPNEVQVLTMNIMSGPLSSLSLS